MHDLTGYSTWNETCMTADVKETLKTVIEGEGIETGKDVGLGGGVVTGGIEWVGGSGSGLGVGDGVGLGGCTPLGSTLEILQRCNPPRSLLTKNTMLAEQSLDALKNRLQPLVPRSFKMMRYVPSSPFNGTKRNKDLPSLGSTVATSEARPRQEARSKAVRGPTHLREPNKKTISINVRVKFITPVHKQNFKGLGNQSRLWCTFCFLCPLSAGQGKRRSRPPPRPEPQKEHRAPCGFPAAA